MMPVGRLHTADIVILLTEYQDRVEARDDVFRLLVLVLSREAHLHGKCPVWIAGGFGHDLVALQLLSGAPPLVNNVDGLFQRRDRLEWLAILPRREGGFQPLP